MRLLLPAIAAGICGAVFSAAWLLFFANINFFGAADAGQRWVAASALLLAACALVVFARIECGGWRAAAPALAAAALAYAAVFFLISPAVDRVLLRMPALNLTSSANFAAAWYLLAAVLSVEAIRRPLFGGKKWAAAVAAGAASLLVVAVVEVQFPLVRPGGYESLGRLLWSGPLIWTTVAASVNFVSPMPATTPSYP